MPRPAHLPKPAPRSAFRRYQRAQVFESVGGHEARCDQLPQSGFDFRFEPARRSHHVGKKQRAPLLQKFKHRLRHRAQKRSSRILRSRMMSSHPIRIFAHKERNRRNPRRNHSPPVFIGSRSFQSRRMRRQAAPSHRACQAQLIEVRRIVVADSACQYKPFPRAGWNFKPLQLPDHFQRSMLASHLRTRSEVLPAQKPVHELRCFDRFDLLAQRRNRQAMNASQQTPLAPLGFVIMLSRRAERAAQNCTAGFDAE